VVGVSWVGESFEGLPQGFIFYPNGELTGCEELGTRGALAGAVVDERFDD